MHNLGSFAIPSSCLLFFIFFLPSSWILERILQEFSFCTREHELIFVCAFRVFTRISTAWPLYSSLPENVCANAFYASANPSSTWIKVSKWHLWWKLARKWRRKKNPTESISSEQKHILTLDERWWRLFFAAASAAPMFYLTIAIKRVRDAHCIFADYFV